MQRRKCEIILGFHLGKKKKKKRTVGKANPFEGVQQHKPNHHWKGGILPPISCCKDKRSEQIFFVSFKSTNQPHFHCTLYSNCIVYTVFTGASRSQESFPAANNSFLTLLLAELSPAPWQSTSSQGQASQTASDWILLSGEQSVCSQLEGTGSIWSSHKAISLHFSTCFCELLPMKLLKKATGRHQL